MLCAAKRIDPNSQIRVRRITADSVGIQFAMPTGAQTLCFLLTVTAFAVYAQINPLSLTSKLHAPVF